MAVARDLTDDQYRDLLAFRSGLRRFLAWSEQEARSRGLTATQHQLLLAVRGWPGGAAPTIGEVAAELQLRHNSAVELVDRCVERGLVARAQDHADRRRVRLRLTPSGRSVLRALSVSHLAELERLSRSFPGPDALDAP